MFRLCVGQEVNRIRRRASPRTAPGPHSTERPAPPAITSYEPFACCCRESAVCRMSVVKHQYIYFSIAIVDERLANRSPKPALANADWQRSKGTKNVLAGHKPTSTSPEISPCLRAARKQPRQTEAYTINIVFLSTRLPRRMPSPASRRRATFPSPALRERGRWRASSDVAGAEILLIPHTERREMWISHASRRAMSIHSCSCRR